MKVAVIGSGVVGQATGKGFATQGHEVVFSDVSLEILVKLRKDGFQTCFPEFLSEKGEQYDVFFLSVCTPTVAGRIFLNHLKDATEELGQGALRKNDRYCVVSPRSTLPPGTTEDFLIPILEKNSGKKAGRDFGVCFNPEYLREKTAGEDFRHPWLVVIGELDQRSGKVLEELYDWVECPVEHTSLAEAEAEKYVHNVFNAAKIAFFNEMRQALQKRGGMDVNKVFRLVARSAEGCWNPMYGLKDFGPFDGSCLPKDTMAFLTWAEEELEMDLPILRTTIEENRALSQRIASKKGNGKCNGRPLARVAQELASAPTV
ncbi:MAG: UDP-glucose/GDP-mannose dehydrogenase family protein [Candidatus Staskawiczbacteria bacterium]|nr:UDP-glucose/GDP-mannose dehydrogenase family protein [Candidatus Staskawiczbacteria bacterium]